MKWASPDDWSGIDLTGHARIWTQDQDSVQRRMTNRSKVWQVESAALNHLAGRTPRMLFGQAFTAGQHSNSDPLFEARWIDNVVNSRSRTYRVLALPRHAETYAADENVAVAIWTNAASSTNAAFPDMAADPVFPQAIYRTFKCARGGASNAVVTEKISSNGVQLVDFVCQEDSVNTLDTALDHSFVFPYAATPGAKIVTGVLEDLRSKFHQLRMNQNRLAFCFLAVGESNTFNATSTGNTGFATTSATYINILDGTTTTRTASSPGVMVPGYGAGYGLSNACGVQVYLLAKAADMGPGTASGMFKVIGPDHVADNNTEIAIEGGSPTWYASGPVHLNTESAEATDTTTARNKFDFHFLGDDGATTQIFVILGFTLQKCGVVA